MIFIAVDAKFIYLRIRIDRAFLGAGSWPMSSFEYFSRLRFAKVKAAISGNFKQNQQCQIELYGIIFELNVYKPLPVNLFNLTSYLRHWMRVDSHEDNCC